MNDRMLSIHTCMEVHSCVSGVLEWKYSETKKMLPWKSDVILGNFVVNISSGLQYCGQQICYPDPETMSQHFFY